MEFGIDIPAHKPFDAVGLGLNAIDHLVVVPHYPEFNSKIKFISSRLAPGGQVATAMVALSRLGLTTKYLGSVGADQPGSFQLESIRSEGVDVSGVRVVEGAESQTAFILIDQKTGERTILWNRDPRLEFPPDRVRAEDIICGKVLHLDGHDVAASIAAAHFAKSAGMPVCLDIDNIYPGVDELLPLIDFLISSSTFPARMTGEPDLKTALRLLHERFGSLMTGATLGGDGALVYFRGEYIHSPAFNIDCRDTTGAGDAFHGGFIYGLLAGFSVERTLQFANAVAGLKCQDVGARTALPNLNEVRSLIAVSIV